MEKPGHDDLPHLSNQLVCIGVTQTVGDSGPSSHLSSQYWDNGIKDRYYVYQSPDQSLV